MSTTKIAGNTTNILSCYFSKQIHTLAHSFSYHKQYLFSVLFPRNAKETHTDQSILENFLLCLKRNVSHTFKSGIFWKKSAFYMCYLHNNITMLLIPRVQDKLLNVPNKINLLVAFFLLFQFTNVPHFSL